MTITRNEFREEERRLKALERKGWAKDGPSDRNLKSWLHGWRQVGARPCNSK